MIAQLTGSVSAVRPAWLALMVGGVGYKVYGSASLLSAVREGEECTVWTHLVVREDALDLYGFAEYAEVELFQLLISVSGVGPKGALGILGLDRIEKLKQAIAASDIAYLTKVSGIGKKSAEKICLELRDKLGELEVSSGPSRSTHTDTLEALISLGYRAEEAREALRLIPTDTTEPHTVLREALKLLSRA